LFGPVFLPLFAHESRRLLAFPFIPLAGYRSGLRSPFPPRPVRCSTFRSWSASLALPTTGSTTPFADFCDTVKVNCFTLSHESVTCRRSSEVSSTAFDAQPPDLPPVSLMDMGFAVIGPLVRHRRPPIRFLYIGSHLLLRASFRPRLAASVISPLRFAITSRPSRCEEDLHLLAVKHARHTKKRAGSQPPAPACSGLKGR
jgi:hypothetical protein